MAAPQTNRLKYYSRDVQMQENEQYIEAVHPIVGFYVVEKLRMHIYGSVGGYYCLFNDFNKRLFCKNNCNVPIETINEILETCFLPDVKLFDKALYDTYHILTSAGIQKRWKKVATESGRKNTVIIPEYCLIKSCLQGDNGTENEDTVEKTVPFQYHNGVIMGGLSVDNGVIIGALTPDNSPVFQQTKLNNTKLKETKLEEIKNLEDRGELPASPTVPVPPKEFLEVKAENIAKREVRRRREKFTPPTQEDCLEYFKKATSGVWHPSLAKLEAQKFFNHYESNGWVQNKDKPIVDWKAAANGWMLREVGDSSYKIERGMLKKVSEKGFTNVEENPEKKLEFYYQQFLENQLSIRKIDADLYEYLKRKELLNFAPGTNTELRQKARRIRADSLEGSNEASVFRLLAAYQLGGSETEEPIKSDVANLNREGRILSIVHFFTLMRDQGKMKLFEKSVAAV